MKIATALVFALTVFTAAAPASAADCRVTGWTSGYGGAPIFVCPDEPRR